MFPVAFPIIISTDIQLIERRMRNIPLDRFDNPFPYIGCVIKSEYTEGSNVIKEMQNITNDK